MGIVTNLYVITLVDRWEKLDFALHLHRSLDVPVRAHTNTYAIMSEFDTSSQNTVPYRSKHDLCPPLLIL